MGRPDSNGPEMSGCLKSLARAPRAMEEVDVLVVGTARDHRPRATSRTTRTTSSSPKSTIGSGTRSNAHGLVSQRVLDLAGSDRFVPGPVQGATVFGPGTAKVSFRAPEARAFVIDGRGSTATSRTAPPDLERDSPPARSSTGWRGGMRARPWRNSCIPTERARRSEHRLILGADGVTSAVARIPAPPTRRDPARLRGRVPRRRRGHR